MDTSSQQRIAQLNDAFRQSFDGGLVVFTQGIHALPVDERMEIIRKVKAFREFTEGNDPHGEHDFGIIKHHGASIYWKIDYYDVAMRYGSEDPSNPAETTRVLTVLRASEY